MELTTIELSFQENHLFIGVGASQLVTRLVDGQFPDYHQVIPAGGSQVTALITGVINGSTRAVVSSAAGTDSMTVNVDSATALIAAPNYYDLVVGDTLRTLVLISEPAPAGGLTVTVRSTDSASVVVAPGTGLGRN